MVLHIAHDYPRLPVVWEKSSQAMDICDPRLDHNQLDDIPRKEGSNSCNIYATLMKSTDPHLAGNHYISMVFFWIATANSDVHHGTTSFLKRRRIFCLSASGFKSSTSLHELRACSKSPTMMSCADKTHQNIGEIEVLLGRKIGFWLLIMGIDW